MTSKGLALMAAGAVSILFLIFIGFRRVTATQVVLTPSADQVRFQLIGNEPIAAPDGQALVEPWSVLVFKDRKSSQCYVVFAQGSAIAAASAPTCPK